MSICPSAWNNSAPTGWIFLLNPIFEYFFRKSVENIQISLKSDKNKGYSTWRLLYIVIVDTIVEKIIVSQQCFEDNVSHRKGSENPSISAIPMIWKLFGGLGGLFWTTICHTKVVPKSGRSDSFV
jgi:hypothetical protein